MAQASQSRDTRGSHSTTPTRSVDDGNGAMTHQDRKQRKKQGNMAAKESHLNEIFTTYSTRSDCLEDAIQVRRVLQEVSSSFSVDEDDKFQLAAALNQLPLPIGRSKFVAVVCENLWNTKRSQSTEQRH